MVCATACLAILSKRVKYSPRVDCNSKCGRTKVFFLSGLWTYAQLAILLKPSDGGALETQDYVIDIILTMFILFSKFQISPFSADKMKKTVQ